VAKYWL